jgi:beta-glucosidase
VERCEVVDERVRRASVIRHARKILRVTAPKRSAALLATVLLCCSQPRPPTTVGVPPLPEYRDLHARYVAAAARDAIDVLFVGDSITYQWSSSPLWESVLAPLRSANFGVPGDGTREVLWRLSNGELSGVTPKIVVLLIGSNDIVGGDPPEAVRDGILTVISEIQRRLTTTHVLLVAILPTGGDLVKWNDAIDRTNALVERARPRDVRWLDLGPMLRGPDGAVPRSAMADGQHLTPLGYERWAAGVLPILKEVLGTPP